MSDSSGILPDFVPRASWIVTLLIGCFTPPAIAIASSNFSCLGVRGNKTLLVTSPTTVTLALVLRVKRTITCGKLALPLKAWTISLAISSVVLPAALMLPAKGMAIIPSRLTICSGKVVALELVELTIDTPALEELPKSIAGEASQILTSKVSPGPIKAPCDLGAAMGFLVTVTLPFLLVVVIVV